MTIRISSLQYMYNYKTALNRAYEKQTKLFEQADGQIIHRGSDDPVAYSKLLRYNVTQAENEQYQRDVNNATSLMKTADSTLQGMMTHAKTIVEKTVQAANTYNTSSDFESIAKEINSCLEEIVSLGNTQQGDRYVFSGQKDITEPFTYSIDTYDRGVAKTLDAAQVKFFKGKPSEGDAFVYQMLSLEDSDGNEYYMDTEYGYIYTKQFVDEGYKELVTMDYSTVFAAQSDTARAETQELLAAGTANYDNNIAVSDTDTFTVSMYFDNKGIIKTTDTSATDSTQIPKTLSATTATRDSDGTVTTNTTVFSFSTISQRIVTYSGDTKNLSMVKHNGANDLVSDVINVTGGNIFHKDIFDDEKSGNETSGVAFINDMISVYSKINAEDVDWLNSDGITLSNAAHNAITLSQTTIGARIQLYESVGTMLDTQSTYITEDITNVSATDVAELATRLMEMTALYNMALSIGGRILPVSLADYL